MEHQPPREDSLARNIGQPALEFSREVGRRVERLSGVNLRIRHGAPLFLRLPFLERRYEGKVVGLEPFEYIIVQTRLPHDVQMRLVQGALLVAQLHMGGVLYGFRTEVLSRISTPAQLLFLAYPATVERMVLRHGERVKVSVPGDIHGSFGDHDVIVQDLAQGGCCFTARSNLNSPLRLAQPGDRVVLHCDLVVSACEQFVGPVLLRRVEEEHGRITMGGQFVDLPEAGGKILHDYVERIVSILGDE